MTYRALVAPVMISDPYFSEMVISKGFKFYQPDHAPSNDKYHDLLSNYLSPNLAALSLSYLTRRETLIREWRIPDREGSCGPTRIAIHPRGGKERSESERDEHERSERRQRGEIYVIDAETHCILIYDRVGTLVREWTGFQSPSAIVISPNGHIYIADMTSIKIFDSDEVYLREFGQEVGLFFPDDIAFSPQGEIYVLNERGIIVFDSAGQFIGRIDPSLFTRERTKGARACEERTGGVRACEEEFIDMNRMIISSNNQVYISDHESSRIQIFETKQEKYRDVLSDYLIPDLVRMTLEYIPPELSHLATMSSIGATGMAISPSGKNIYLSSINFGDSERGEHERSEGQVSIFSPDRVYQSKIIGEFTTPNDIVISPQGEIYIVDSGTRLIKIFGSRYY
jgi:DNA-binding beta-propeller fold protein YncE